MDVNLKLIIEIDCDPEDDAANFIQLLLSLSCMAVTQSVRSRQFIINSQAKQQINMWTMFA
ncbi:uncharacterized protein LOC143450510 isoform X2 [Clavelina lepadiformis]|uniref:uncharacterized protein LOC143448574 isoform X2 n=1 Tax=Clavelina lepadiformis TaxID=159417 RepID=UPI00404325CF